MTQVNAASAQKREMSDLFNSFQLNTIRDNSPGLSEISKTRSFTSGHLLHQLSAGGVGLASSKQTPLEDLSRLQGLTIGR
jgi:hypothetical protein